MFEPSSSATPDKTSDYRRKIVSLEQLIQIAGEMRKPQDAARKSIVLCHGCFDIVHPGHIRYLEFARTQGDILVVSITADAAIEKGDQRPYIPQELRAENLAALELVHYVLIDPNPTAGPLIHALLPDVYIKGQEYATNKDPRFLAERREVESYGGRVIFSSGDVVFSSTRLGEAVTQANGLAERRQGLICRRHGIDLRSLSAFLDGMHGKRVLVFGDTVVHRYVLCDATDIATESPMMSLTELDNRDYLGAAATVAIQAAVFGARTLLVTGIGEDSYSERAMMALAEAGVQVRAIRPRPDMAVKTRFLVDDRKLLRVDRVAVCPLDSVGEQRAVNLLAEHAANADAAIVLDSGHGLITPGVLQLLSGEFRRRVPIIAGGAAETRGNLRGLRQFDLLCTSERKLRMALNDFGGGLSTLAYRMLQDTQAGQMLVTLAKRGMVTFDRRSHDPQSAAWGDRLRSEHLPSFAQQAVDSLGCSEAILTVATLAMACGASLMQAAYLTTAAAAIQIATLGLVPIQIDDLRSWLAHRPELTLSSESELDRVQGPLSKPRQEHALTAV
jgi:rfaE bifunctional protein nucleotidyltransferase chain/domain